MYAREGGSVVGRGRVCVGGWVGGQSTVDCKVGGLAFPPHSLASAPRLGPWGPRAELVRAGPSDCDVCGFALRARPLRLPSCETAASSCWRQTTLLRTCTTTRLTMRTFSARAPEPAAAPALRPHLWGHVWATCVGMRALSGRGEGSVWTFFFFFFKYIGLIP
jgi:hypothetical protein